MGVPEKPRCGEVVGFIHLDSMTPQDGSTHLAGSLAAVYEENLPVSKNGTAAKWWWAIHTTHPNESTNLER